MGRKTLDQLAQDKADARLAKLGVPQVVDEQEDEQEAPNENVESPQVRIFFFNQGKSRSEIQIF